MEQKTEKNLEEQVAYATPLKAQSKQPYQLQAPQGGYANPLNGLEEVMQGQYAMPEQAYDKGMVTALKDMYVAAAVYFMAVANALHTIYGGDAGMKPALEAPGYTGEDK